MQKDNPDLINATITQITKAGPRIKIYKLSHNKVDYQFKPGQWIDLYAPIEGKNIGGYTIISNPEDKGFIELAIRESGHHPVTKYMHEKAQVDSILKITEGQGRFFLPPQIDSELIFIAGGIGVTPLLSMMRWLKERNSPHHLFYSSSYEQDIILKEELSLNTDFFVTKDPLYSGYKTRITIDHLKNSQVNYKKAHYYICGPKEMIDFFVQKLLEVGIEQTQLHYEKWW